jgi:hypothetical protein
MTAVCVGALTEDSFGDLTRVGGRRSFPGAGMGKSDRVDTRVGQLTVACGGPGLSTVSAPWPWYAT